MRVGIPCIVWLREEGGARQQRMRTIPRPRCVCRAAVAHRVALQDRHMTGWPVVVPIVAPVVVIVEALIVPVAVPTTTPSVVHVIAPTVRVTVVAGPRLTVVVVPRLTRLAVVPCSTQPVPLAIPVSRVGVTSCDLCAPALARHHSPTLPHAPPLVRTAAAPPAAAPTTVARRQPDASSQGRTHVRPGARCRHGGRLWPAQDICHRLSQSLEVRDPRRGPLATVQDHVDEVRARGGRGTGRGDPRSRCGRRRYRASRLRTAGVGNRKQKRTLTELDDLRAHLQRLRGPGPGQDVGRRQRSVVNAPRQPGHQGVAELVRQGRGPRQSLNHPCLRACEARADPGGAPVAP